MATSSVGGQIVEIARLSKDTLQDKVFRQVTELILNGSIEPGQMVTVQSLADAFGVSAMPVREALHRLSAAKALTVVSGRSMGIPPLSRDRLKDLYDVRIELEAIAAGWAAQRRNDDDVETAERHLAALEEAVEQGDVKSYLKANYTFHFAIYRAAGSDSLLQIIENLWLQVSPYFNRLAGSHSVNNSIHRSMFLALRDRDFEAINSAIRADINGAYQVLSKRLNE